MYVMTRPFVRLDDSCFPSRRINSFCLNPHPTVFLVFLLTQCYDAADFVRVGIHSRELSWSADYDVIPIAQRIVHPNYDSDRYDHDLMVMKLAVPSNKAYIKLNSNHDIPNSSSSGSNRTMWIMGFGDTDQTAAQALSTTLQVASVQYVPTSTCLEAYQKFSPITDDMICAAQSGKDACGGDSGGPLIMRGNSTARDLLVGTVAWGVGCAEERYPGVYSRISFFYDWIVEQVCALSSSSSEVPDYMSCPTPSPTVSASPSMSQAPSSSVSPSSAPTVSVAPSPQPSYDFINTLRFVGWSVPVGGPLLEHCQGDCDTDEDCEEGLVCFYRCAGEDVPGCLPGTLTGAAYLISDICIHPWDV
jgi:trypsin